MANAFVAEELNSHSAGVSLEVTRCAGCRKGAPADADAPSSGCPGGEAPGSCRREDSQEMISRTGNLDALCASRVLRRRRTVHQRRSHGAIPQLLYSRHARRMLFQILMPASSISCCTSRQPLLRRCRAQGADGDQYPLPGSRRLILCGHSLTQIRRRPKIDRTPDDNPLRRG